MPFDVTNFSVKRSFRYQINSFSKFWESSTQGSDRYFSTNVIFELCSLLAFYFYNSKCCIFLHFSGSRGPARLQGPARRPSAGMIGDNIMHFLNFLKNILNSIFHQNSAP